jgi:hypothetical protein
VLPRAKPSSTICLPLFSSFSCFFDSSSVGYSPVEPASFPAVVLSVSLSGAKSSTLEPLIDYAVLS